VVQEVRTADPGCRLVLHERHQYPICGSYLLRLVSDTFEVKTHDTDREEVTFLVAESTPGKPFSWFVES